jgi:hypothetical protein
MLSVMIVGCRHCALAVGVFATSNGIEVLPDAGWRPRWC